MKKEITSTLTFSNSKYVKKVQTNDYRVLQLEKSLQEFILEVKIPPDQGESKF